MFVGMHPNLFDQRIKSDFVKMCNILIWSDHPVKQNFQWSNQKVLFHQSPNRNALDEHTSAAVSYVIFPAFPVTSCPRGHIRAGSAEAHPQRPTLRCGRRR